MKSLPYLFISRQHLWRRQYYWTLWHRRVDARPKQLAASDHAHEIFDLALATCRRLRCTLRGRWRGAFRRYHRQRAFSFHPPPTGKALRQREYNARRRMAAKGMQHRASAAPMQSEGGLD